MSSTLSSLPARPFVPFIQPSTVSRPLTAAVIVYRNDAGETFRQPVADVFDVGTLIDPETGEDLEALYLEISTDPPAVNNPLPIVSETGVS